MLTTRAIGLDGVDIKDDDKDDIRRGLAYQLRTAFIIGPQKYFRLILNFPASVGMSTAEVFRLIDALQTAAKAKYVSAHPPARMHLSR